MNAPAGVAVRAAAARVLDAVLHQGHSLKAELAAQLPTFDDPRDRALLEAIAFAALREHARYGAALAQWMCKPPGRRDGPLRALLYAGFAQLDSLHLPPHAALAATVDATRALGRMHQAGLVNALLRRTLREGLPASSAAAAWPQWLLCRLREDWPGELDAIVTASALPAPLWLRVNRQRGSVAACSARLEASRIQAQPGPRCPDGLRIDAPVPVSALPGFADGALSVQDGSAQLVAEALAPAAGARVLGACAAPGGKAAHLLERDPTLRLTALDIDYERLQRLRATFARLGVGAQAQLHAADATDVGAWWDGAPFDAILLDAPCSATGIVRRQPDILLHRRAADIDALCALQARLLDALWPTLATGGTLLYATCSILRAENDAQVAAFLARTPDAQLQPLDARFGRDSGHGHQRLPGEDGMDGFFYARLVKRAP
ncbi:16S rRNA (cytosine(967)-C(5))-methyltransferase RsmB [Cognatiluteimonas weifangensis]|uniref:16S rRNA (cytosine(967)-C(5))-methyltransferase n=1 Tax=Cognatiluteimonas weifangensis TaxID=2303539 RepID=A0A372DPX4_9GAMM|nr:16S rRNA (cytosine(967)-C(5))-methyltransferase RsmB [Luteimonas weifangensis]RFP61554.1 16S rRNA (cytosine(967)-C(5))-methyltransferase RsmB [Luteimonas weifangensis]